MIILHKYLLFFRVKKVADFLYHRPEMLRNITCGKIFNCLFGLHIFASRFVLRIKKSVRFRLPFQARSSHGFQSELFNFLGDFI